MTEHDQQLGAELESYYRQLAQQPAPDVTARVMLATDARSWRRRRWGVVGGAALTAVTAAVVIVVALLNHGSPTSVGPAHSPTPAPTAAATVTPSHTPPPSMSPPVGAPGPSVHGFVPTDVTAVTASEWWVLGYNGPSCASASCTRILHTTDGGLGFTSIASPPTPPAQGAAQPDRLRFADRSDGWLVSGNGAVWATHDGGTAWAPVASAGSVVDLEASAGATYAVTCADASSCAIERSPVTQDSWSVLSASTGHGLLGRLNVNGPHIWATIASPAGGPGSLVVSADAGQHFTERVMCPGALGYPGLYAVDSSVLWGTCATGTAAGLVRSVDGGQHFSPVPGPFPSISNGATIAGVSSTTAVVGAEVLLRTTDGGQSFSTVEDLQTRWTMVGFTTSVNGFAFHLPSSGVPTLWRTDDAGGHWHQVQFP